VLWWCWRKKRKKLTKLLSGYCNSYTEETPFCWFSEKKLNDLKSYNAYFCVNTEILSYNSEQSLKRPRLLRSDIYGLRARLLAFHLIKRSFWIVSKNSWLNCVYQPKSRLLGCQEFEPFFNFFDNHVIVVL
jgi:hypothetical protein